MRTILVVIIVTVCFAPIFIGFGFGIANLLEETPFCYVKYCGDNEEIKHFDDYSASCICLSYAQRNDITQKCVLMEPQWVSNYTFESIYDWSKFVHMGIVDDIMARIVYDNGDIIPCEARIEYDNMNVKSIEPNIGLYRYDYKRLEVLQGAPSRYEWVQSSNGTILDNAIEGGQINGEIVYVCRVGIHAGVMQPSLQTCKSGYFGSFSSSYDLLVHKN